MWGSSLSRPINKPYCLSAEVPLNVDNHIGFEGALIPASFV
jgi:hypothetical protein